MERALVIGATGFVGHHILRALIHSDIEVDAMRRWNSAAPSVRQTGVDTVVADLLDADALWEVLAGYNYVFMAAAPDPGLQEAAYMQASVMGMRHLLRVARKVDVERVVVTSCATTIAAPANGAMSTAAEVYLPGSANDVLVDAQYAAELECFREAADGMEIVILNPGICVGEGAVLPAPKLLRDVSPEARINAVDVDDVARAHVEAARLTSFGERFALGGENTTVGELYARLEPAAGSQMRLGRYDVELSDRPDGLRNLPLFRRGTWLDSARAEREFGFRPRSL